MLKYDTWFCCLVQHLTRKWSTHSQGWGIRWSNFVTDLHPHLYPNPHQHHSPGWSIFGSDILPRSLVSTSAAYINLPYMLQLNLFLKVNYYWLMGSSILLITSMENGRLWEWRIGANQCFRCFFIAITLKWHF